MQQNPFDQFDEPGGNPFDGPMIIQPNARRIEEEERRRARQDAADRRANEAAMRAANADARAADAAMRASQPQAPSGYRFTADGGLEAIPGGPADKSTRGGGSSKTMRQGDSEKLEKDVAAYDALSWANNSFQDDFAGNAMTGELENWAQQKFGFGTPGQRDWWARFRATDNVIRNDLFGASLTEGEKAAYEATTISPSMDPAVIRQNLATRQGIVEKSLSRRAKRLVAGGFSEEEVRAGLGEYAETFLPSASQEPVMPVQNPSNPMQGVSANGAVAQTERTGQYLAGQSEDAWVMEPKLRGLGATVKRMIQNGRSADEINAYVSQRYDAAGAVHIGPDQRQQIAGLVAAHRKNPTIPVGQLATDWGNFEMVPRRGTGEASITENIAKSPLGAFSVAAGNAASVGLSDEIAGLVAGDTAQQRFQAVKDQMREESPYASLAGDVVGGTIGMVGGNRALGALGQAGQRAAQFGGGIIPDVGYGVAYGAGESNDNRALGALTGGASAGVGNLVGRGVTGMFGRGLKGVSDPAVKYLTERGVPLTPGQILGNSGPVGRGIAKLESLPVIGDMLNTRRLDGFKAFNKAAYDDALSPLGVQFEGNAGQEAVEVAQDAVGDAYSSALDGVQLNVDLPYKQELGRILGDAANMPAPLREQFHATLNARVAPNFRQDANGVIGIDGKGYQAALKGMKMDAGSLLRRSEPMADLFKDGTVAVEGALNNLAERQAPGVVSGLRAANTANRNVSILEDASLAGLNSQAGSGIFTPAQLGSAMRSNTKKFGGKKAAARGDMPFSELQRYGQEVLPSTIPNSHTADRLAAMAMPAALGGASYSVSDISPTTAGGLATLALLSSRPGSKAAQKLLVSRPEAVSKIGEQLYRRRRIGGMFGAPLAISVGVGSE